MYRSRKRKEEEGRELKLLNETCGIGGVQSLVIKREK